MRNESVHIYGEYVDLCKSLNGILLCIFAEYVECVCLYTENMWNKPVSILRMHKKSKYLGESKPKSKMF